MLSLEDFYDDELLLRQTKRAQRKDAHQDDDDDDGEDDDGPRGTQRDRPEQIDEDEEDDGVDIDAEEDRSKMIAKVKRERARSRDVSMAPSHGAIPSSQIDGDDIEVMDED